MTAKFLTATINDPSSIWVVCRALHCHHSGNADEVSKAAEVQDTSQVTPIRFSYEHIQMLAP